MDKVLGPGVLDQRLQRDNVAPTSGRSARACACTFSLVPARTKRQSYGRIVGR